MRCQCRFKIARCWPYAAKPKGLVFGGILLLACLSGCAAGFQATFAPYLEHARRASIIRDARSEAKQTWAECHADRYSCAGVAADTKHGFVTGYADTASGFVNSPPPVPVRPCISIHTLTGSYPDAGEWYAGYYQGSAEALSKGVDQWRLAPIDPGLLEPPCGSEILSHPSGLPLEHPLGAMIGDGQYREPEQSIESPRNLPTPKEPDPRPQQNSELILKPSDAESI